MPKLKHFLLASLLFFTALAAASGTALLSARAEETPDIGQHMIEMTDLNGQKQLLPAWYDGKQYLLADYRRNIFVHNGFDAGTLQELVAGVNRLPIYNSPTGNFTDAMAVSLYKNIITAYDFYSEENIGENHFGVKGKDDDVFQNWKGNSDEVPIHAFTHFNSGAYRYNATCFTERDMCFLVAGDGDPQNSTYDIYHQAACLDVIAHEYQHGIAKHLKDGLEYEGESGALDEAFADIFGMLISSDDMTKEEFWEIGEGCSVSGQAQRRVDYPLLSRDKNYRMTLQTKRNCFQHSHGTHNSSCDNNFVHQNSTIVSHVQFTAWEIAPESFTRQTIAKLWYETLKKLGYRATFQDFAAAIQSTAADILDEPAMNALEYSLYTNGFTDKVMHKVTFLGEDGSALFSVAVPHGGAIEEIRPQFKNTEKYDYVFQGWDKDLSFITEDLTVNILYEKVPKKFTVRFVQDDGTLLEEIKLPYGSRMVYPEQKPQKKSSKKDVEYRFAGWNGIAEIVTGDMTIVAMYDEIPIERNPALPIALGVTGGVLLLGGTALGIYLFSKKRRK